MKFFVLSQNRWRASVHLSSPPSSLLVSKSSGNSNTHSLSLSLSISRFINNLSSQDAAAAYSSIDEYCVLGTLLLLCIADEDDNSAPPEANCFTLEARDIMRGSAKQATRIANRARKPISIQKALLWW